ncbi:MAG TPA: dihydrodipicolinate reductase C-terminal domain-containing protein [Gemmatimonadales bacterium]|jgi:4-hydroxy-tetrahydrodipicolinate reductase|nr:dihydrodipicolinate reductase C-terminal domain-containing protein [Gemmatimonadales bacterium]
MNIAIIGNGKMGKAVAELAGERGHVIHTVVNRVENPGGRALTQERLSGADVAVEFTRPDAAVANLERLIQLGIPTVTGTTGWTEELPRVSALVEQRGTALLHAANFSVGVHLFFHAARDLARRFRGRPEFTVSIHEEHHAAKVDAPSGTALLLQRQLWAEEPGRRFPITSERSGEAPGNHTLTYEGTFETISLSHVTRSRQVFAAGALSAAEWLPGHTGVFTFEDMLFGEST